MPNKKFTGLRETETSEIKGFRKLSPRARIELLKQKTNLLDKEWLTISDQKNFSLDIANGMIENVVGTFQIPLGIATNFLINNNDYLIPMAVEEPSVIAAASHMAKLVRKSGGFKTTSTDPIMRAQIQLLDIVDSEVAKKVLLDFKADIISLANSKDKTLVRLGGGCKSIEVETFLETLVGPMTVLHLLVDVRDAMGANTVNTMAETVAPLLEQITGGRAKLKILSNLTDLRLARADIKIPVSDLSFSNFSGEIVAKGIIEAYALAQVDPYRAATHNKGIMNGVDSVVLATGNDWRAIEAGAHAWAARGGSYAPLSTWKLDSAGHLIGSIELPLAVGLIGGATKTHPTSRACINLLGVQSASELSEVLAAVGLAQNMGALRALATEGIQKGHMSLHARNIALAAGVTDPDIDLVCEYMIRANNISVDEAIKYSSKINPTGHRDPN